MRRRDFLGIIGSLFPTSIFAQQWWGVKKGVLSSPVIIDTPAIPGSPVLYTELNAVTYDVNTNISILGDESGNGNTLTQPDETKRPGYNSSAQNGRRAAVGDGTEKILTADLAGTHTSYVTYYDSDDSSWKIKKLTQTDTITFGVE